MSRSPGSRSPSTTPRSPPNGRSEPASSSKPWPPPTMRAWSRSSRHRPGSPSPARPAQAGAALRDGQRHAQAAGPGQAGETLRRRRCRRLHAQGNFAANPREARITAPADGWVVYAGEFRSYGQLLIINAGGGYHVLLAGMSRIDVSLGQFVLAGEPIAVMGNSAAPSQGDDSSRPVLYVEFQKGRQANRP